LRTPRFRKGARRPATSSFRIICIELWRSDARFVTHRDFGDARDDEAKLIAEFFKRVDRYVPQLVSWNGGGFDLPVLHYRGLIHGVTAKQYWDLGEDNRDFKWNNYINRYHMRHTDLMDLLAMYQPRASAPLDAMARLAGFAGKLAMDGAQVWPAFQSGRINEIRAYCETDVVNTYLLYCRFQKLRGILDGDAYSAELKVVHDVLAAAPGTHWREYLDAWPSDSGQ
jgi:3'-5' exonuclease